MVSTSSVWKRIIPLFICQNNRHVTGRSLVRVPSCWAIFHFISIRFLGKRNGCYSLWMVHIVYSVYHLLSVVKCCVCVEMVSFLSDPCGLYTTIILCCYARTTAFFSVHCPSEVALGKSFSVIQQRIKTSSHGLRESLMVCTVRRGTVSHSTIIIYSITSSNIILLSETFAKKISKGAWQYKNICSDGWYASRLVSRSIPTL